MNGSNIAGGNPTRGRVANDYYATHQDSTLALLGAEPFNYPVLEPACGEGHISKLLDGSVVSSDLVDRGYGLVDDFLSSKHPDNSFPTVITNPPFNLFKEFVERGLEVASEKLILFGKLQALEGKRRADYLETTPLKYVYVFKSRQQPLRNGKIIDPLTNKPWASSTMAFAWFVWEKGYVGNPQIKWLDTARNDKLDETAELNQLLNGDEQE